MFGFWILTIFIKFVSHSTSGSILFCLYFMRCWRGLLRSHSPPLCFVAFVLFFVSACSLSFVNVICLRRLFCVPMSTAERPQQTSRRVKTTAWFGLAHLVFIIPTSFPPYHAFSKRFQHTNPIQKSVVYASMWKRFQYTTLSDKENPSKYLSPAFSKNKTCATMEYFMRQKQTSIYTNL